jgi:hypothetical protein
MCTLSWSLEFYFNHGYVQSSIYKVISVDFTRGYIEWPQLVLGIGIMTTITFDCEFNFFSSLQLKTDNATVRIYFNVSKVGNFNNVAKYVKRTA